MTLEERFWQFMLVLVGLISVAAPAYVAYDIYHRGPSSEKRVELFENSPIDLKTDLSDLGDEAKLLLNIKSETFDNLVIVKAGLKNAGASPILPADFIENLSISALRPWRIVAVENTKDLPDGIKIKWFKVNDNRFEAKPTLLNPGDSTNVVIYLTKLTPKTYNELSQPVKLTWDARVTNLPKLTRVESTYTIESHSLSVYLEGWGLAATILGALLFQALYLHLLSKAGYLRKVTSFSSLVMLLSTSLLSFAAAECITFYLFPTFVSILGNKNYLMNGTIIAVHIGLLIWLYRKSRGTAT